MQKINFFPHDRQYRVRSKKKLVQTIENLLIREGFYLNKLNYIFCSDEYLLDINIKFLKHNYFTDIITFDLSNSENEVDGEIYISIDRVIENANHLDVSFRNELLRVIFHGALHLCGYHDKKKKDIAIMRQREDEYVNSFLKQN